MDPRDTLRAGIEFVRAELSRLRELSRTEGFAGFTAEQRTAIDEGADYVERTEAEIKRYDRIEAAVASGATTPGQFTPPTGVNLNRADDPYDLSSIGVTATRSQLQGRALTAIERTEGLSDAHREAASRLVKRVDTPSGALARHLLATGSEAYRTAWQKLVAGQPHMMSNDERNAMEAARALSLTDANGGFAVPFTLDPTIISTRNTSTNPYRRISTIRTTVTDQWQGVTSGGMTVSWDGEAAEVSDDSPTLGSAPIPVKKAQGFAVASIEISQDWASIEEDLREMIREGKDDAEAVAFTIGSGANQPTGIITALDGTASEVAPTTAETFAVADLYKLEEALPPKYRLARMDGDVQVARATMLGNKAIYNDVRQFDNNGGADLWVQLGGGQPPQLLGYNAYEASAMDGAINPAATADNFVLLLGDFRYYVIVDRVGLSVEFIPHIFGANQRPTGQRGWYCYWRVGADSVNDDAFRVLNIATTA